MIRMVAACGLALVLAACGDTPLDPEGGDDPLAGGDVQVQAGLYRTQTTLTGGPQGASGSQYADDTQCLTSEDVKGGYREMLLGLQGRDACRFDSYAFVGDQLDAVMICQGDQFVPETEARITGTVTPTATDLRMTVGGFGGAEGEGRGVAMQVTTERIGDCPEEGE